MLDELLEIPLQKSIVFCMPSPLSAWTMIIRTAPRKGVPNTLRWAAVSGTITVSS